MMSGRFSHLKMTVFKSRICSMEEHMNFFKKNGTLMPPEIVNAAEVAKNAGGYGSA